MPGGIQLIISIIERIEPPERFDRVFVADIEIQAHGEEIIRVSRFCLGNCSNRSRRIVILPLLAVQQVCSRESVFIFHRDIYPVAKLEFEPDTGYSDEGKRSAPKCGACARPFSHGAPGPCQYIVLYSFADIAPVFMIKLTGKLSHDSGIVISRARAVDSLIKSTVA